MANVLYEVKSHIGYVTVNRPDVLNCFNYEHFVNSEAVDSIHVDPEVRVVIFTGAGEKAFSAGADLKERKTLNEVRSKKKCESDS